MCIRDRGYGVRIDPIYKTAKFHAGMDFSANIGTPVYATGDGTVVKAGWETGLSFSSFLSFSPRMIVLNPMAANLSLIHILDNTFRFVILFG